MRELTKYYDCPECYGQGEQLEARLYPTGHTEVWVKCSLCEGEGNFTEEDYLIMRLEGRV